MSKHVTSRRSLKSEQPPFSRPRLLTAAESTSTGTATVVDQPDGSIQVTVPSSGASVGVLSNFVHHLVWDTGYTVQDVLDRYIGVRVELESIDAGTSGDICVGSAIYFSAGAIDIAADDYIWSQNTFGQATESNTTAAVVSRKRANSVNNSGPILITDFKFSDILVRLHSQGTERSTFVCQYLGSGDQRTHNNSDSVAVAKTNKVYAVLGFGRTATEGASVTLNVKPYFLKPGSA